jgi:hypothetical protein
MQKKILNIVVDPVLLLIKQPFERIPELLPAANSRRLTYRTATVAIAGKKWFTSLPSSWTI